MEGESSVAADAATDAGAVGASAVPEAFSFAWLESQIAQLAQVDDERVDTRLERYGSIAGVIVAVVGVTIALLLHNQYSQKILLCTALLQWLCVAAVVLNVLRRALRAYKRQHNDFARDLDYQLVQYNEIVEAIRHYPLSTICTHLRYVRDRSNRLTYRAGMISGGLEKLGILPLLVAMYFQIKDWSFGDWKGLADHIHVLGSVLLSALMVLYAVSWWAVRAKGRLNLYEMVLTEASVRESDGK